MDKIDVSLSIFKMFTDKGAQALITINKNCYFD